jgi:hypothetical protein
MTSSTKAQLAEGFKEFGKLLIAPPFILFVVIAVTTSLWLDSFVAFLLRSSLWLPGGWALYLITASVGGCIIGGMIMMFVRMSQMRPFAKAARECRKAGDAAGYEEKRVLWRAAALRIRPPMWTMLLAFSVIGPLCTATVLASNPPVFGVREHARMRYSTREESIVRMATMIQHDGLMTKR